jgi:hypothetical protein
MVVCEAITIWLIFDSALWISNRKRYMIFFEQVFDTPESAASIMRWVQGITGFVFGCVTIGGLLLLERRARRQEISNEKAVV